MVPTFTEGQRIFINKLADEPHRGDIIVFRYPEDPNRDFIKRVIGIEGDVVEGKNKQVFVNGKLQNEPYVQHVDTAVRTGGMEPRDNFGPYLIPKGKVFVMGDNRDQSYDSRYWGYVDLKDIRGKAFIIYWSWDSQKSFPRFGRIGNLIH